MPTMKDETNPHFHTIPEAKVIPQELNFKMDFSEDQGLMETGKGVSRAPVIHCCAQCGTTQTPQWRNGPRGPRTLCNACGIRLHRRLNKLKLGTTQRRRKKTTKSTFKTPSNSRHYLRTKTPSNSGVSRPRSQRLRSRKMREMGSSLTRVRSFRCEDFTAAIDLLSLSKEGYRTIGQNLERLPNRYESLKREIGVSEGELMGLQGTDKMAGISGEETLRQLRFHEAYARFEAFISQQLESTMRL